MLRRGAPEAGTEGAGRTLRERLRREGLRPCGRALGVAGDGGSRGADARQRLRPRGHLRPDHRTAVTSARVKAGAWRLEAEPERACLALTFDWQNPGAAAIRCLQRQCWQQRYTEGTLAGAT